MSDQPREGGALFKQREKRSEKAPDWKGDVTMDGIKYGIAAWERKTRNGDTFLSVKLEPFRERAAEGAAPAGRAGGYPPEPARQPISADLGDDIPFLPCWQ